MSGAAIDPSLCVCGHALEDHALKGLPGFPEGTRPCQGRGCTCRDFLRMGAALKSGATPLIHAPTDTDDQLFRIFDRGNRTLLATVTPDGVVQLSPRFSREDLANILYTLAQLTRGKGWARPRSSG